MNPRGGARAIGVVLAGGLLAGALDIAFACAFWALKAGVPAQRILQSVASGLLGRASFQGGAATAALGLALHFAIALAMALAYALMARRWSLLQRRPWLGGAVYGAAALCADELRGRAAIGGDAGIEGSAVGRAERARACGPRRHPDRALHAPRVALSRKRAEYGGAMARPSTANETDAMQFLLLVYTDEALLGELPQAEYDSHMRHCLQNADELQQRGTLLGFQQLEAPTTAKSVRVRRGQSAVLDGPFAETKEVLAGFNLIEADSIDDAVRVAQQLPWTRYGCIEVRPVRDIAAVRARVGG
jgi:hypothetical protein